LAFRVALLFVTDSDGDILVFKRMFEFSRGRILFNKKSANFLGRVIIPNLNFVGNRIAFEIKSLIIISNITAGGDTLLLVNVSDPKIVIKGGKPDFGFFEVADADFY